MFFQHFLNIFRPEIVDDDVKEAAEAVNTDPDNLLRVINLTKKFKNFDAVRGLTFGVKKNECFGLLGVNGAGKTTAFRKDITNTRFLKS